MRSRARSHFDELVVFCDSLKMSQMKVRRLSEAAVDQLSAVFDEEAMHWKEQLFWDYQPTLRLIERLVSARSLPGFVLMEDGEAVGYTYFVFERPVGFIGGLYVLDSFAGQSSYSRMIDRLISSMRSLSDLERIESQLMPLNREFASSFVSLGFRALPRYFLSAVLSRANVLKQLDASTQLGGFVVQSWSPEFAAAAAEVIYDSYIESPDLDLCRDYQSRKGCARFLRNLIGSPTCGRFSSRDTKVALDKRGRPCGVLLATKIDQDTGMIPQFSVRRDCQGRGIGSRLLAEYLKEAADKGLKRVSLSVSQANQRAFDLYRRVGFEPEKRFHALIWER